MMIVLLIIVSIGFVAVAVILFNEQIAKSVLSKEITTQVDINKKIQNDIDHLKVENERLTHELHQKDEVIGAYLAAGENLIAEQLHKIKLSEIMASQVISTNVEAPFSEVARKMQQNDIRHLPIVDDDFKLVGMMTQRMLYQIRSPRKLIDGEWYYDEEILNDVILKNVMEKEVITLQPNQSIGKALMKMAYSKCGGIPIVDDDNKLVGIVTRKDILKFTASIYQNVKH